MKLDGSRIIVSGAASGMGRHFALRLSEAGARVAIGDVNEAGLAETVTLSQKNAGGKGSVVARRLDVGNEGDVGAFVAWAQDALGGIDALVNNAGVLRDGLLVKRDKETGAVTKLSKEQWDAVIGVNLTGAALLARDTVARMVEGASAAKPGDPSRGVVVNISSVSRHGMRGQSNYSAAKAGLATMTRVWALEWSSFGVRCGCVAPGMVETPMTRGMNQKARDALVAAVPVGRIGEPEDLWLAVKFVIECDYFNARVIDVDGGLGG
ncbi:MAG TPA: SDR family oxidoreductase [Polyangiaceae bacterium]|jgi:3-oxoacyl-[acyl-carrier protein] reductase|nr:SDR family oxidoreductase [Polyangiaceae bacterium]